MIHNYSGRPAYKEVPLTGQELVQELQKQDLALPVYFYWEGLLIPITADRISKDKPFHEPYEPCIVLYADQD